MRAVLLCLLLACERPADVPSPLPAFVPSSARQAELVATVASAAHAFRDWPRVDHVLRAAPIPCAAGDIGTRPSSRPSVSIASDGAHARKLFYLRSNDGLAYAGDEPLRPGFVVVKESFASLPVSEDRRRDCNSDTGPYCMQRDDTVNVDGTWLRAGASTELFVMAKVEPLAGTDEHWVYGTVSSDGRVMAAGRLPSCMGCHEDATHERLFGL